MNGARHPRRLVLHALRPLARLLVRTRYRVRLHHTDRVPSRGPVILAANHVGLIDGPLLVGFAPRGVHALTKQEMFRGRFGGFLSASGQIPLDRQRVDRAAINSCLVVLERGRTVGVFPEGTRGDGELRRLRSGAAYLALVTGAPVVPVTMVGTRDRGGGNNSVPARGTRIDITFGEPWQVPAQPWPRRQDDVRSHSEDLRSHMLRGQRRALLELGRTLPGPIPAGGADHDPDTRPTDQQAGTA